MPLRLPFLFTVIFLSCNYEPIPPSLWRTGKHKKEFKKLINRYSNPEDSLKLRAAEYLIQNLGNHYYRQPKNGDEIDNFCRSLKSQLSIDYSESTELYTTLRREFINLSISERLSDGRLHVPKYRKRSDLNTIKAEFIIENIEYAFKAWEFPWAQHYTFNEFCHYILPYRYGTEAPSAWRKTIYEQYLWVADTVNNPHDPVEVASFINSRFNNKLSFSEKLNQNGIRLKVSNQLDAGVYGNCFEQAGLGVSVMRAMGIPATMLSIPQWGDLAYGHEVTAVLDAEKNWHYFNFGDAGPEIKYEFRAPKMYLRHFNRSRRFKSEIEDVSERLMEVTDLEVDIRARRGDEIYLCTFGNLNWHPLCKGINLGSSVVFEDVGQKKILYLAAVKSRGKMIAVSNIFTTDTLGNITYHKPDMSKSHSVSLVRKFKPWTYIHRLESLIGGEFSVSENKNFESNKLLYKIDTILKYNDNTVKCKEQVGKYFRYDFPQRPDSIFDGPAEVSFYTTRNNTLEKLEGKYFGSPQLSEYQIQLMTDNDMLSYVEVWDCEKDLEIETGRFILRKDNQSIWLGMELDTPTTVTHVGICPRNDKNGIYPGMRYELLYWDDAWKSLGRKVATSDSIQYKGVPENAVLWLRNLDEGKEERIFMMEGGEQVWW